MKRFLSLLLSIVMLISVVFGVDFSSQAASSFLGAPIDITFVVDATGSMSDEITSVRNNLKNFATTLKNENTDVSFSLIHFTNSNYTVHKFGSSNWTNDVSRLQTEFSSFSISGDGEIPLKTLNYISSNNWNFREDATKFVFLLTDEPQGWSDQGTTAINGCIQGLISKNIYTSVVTTSSLESTYRDLYQKTGGNYFNISGNYSTLMQTYAEQIVKTAVSTSTGYAYGDGDDAIQKGIFRSKSYNKIEDYKKFVNLDLSPYIPGVKFTAARESITHQFSKCKGMVMQGVCFAGKNNKYMLVSAYCHEHIACSLKKNSEGKYTEISKHDSVIYVMSNNNPKNRELITTISLTDTTHAGGLAFDGKRVWIASTSSVKYIDMSDIESAIASGKKYTTVGYTGSVKTKDIGEESIRASYLTCYSNKLVIGEYSSSSSDNKICGYEITEKGDHIDISSPVFTFTGIEKYVQGVEFIETDDKKTYMFLSVAQGRSHKSYIPVFEVTNLNEGLKTKLATYEVPGMMEDATICGGYLYLGNESASDTYYGHPLNYIDEENKNGNKAKYVTDRISAFEYNNLIPSNKKSNSASANYQDILDEEEEEDVEVDPAESTLISTGYVGDYAYYEFYDDGSLNINGFGETYDYEKSPFTEIAGNITSVSIGRGITKIGRNLFCELNVSNDVSINVGERGVLIDEGAFKDSTIQSLTIVGSGSSNVNICTTAFENCTSLKSINVTGVTLNAQDDAFKNTGDMIINSDSEAVEQLANDLGVALHVHDVEAIASMDADCVNAGYEVYKCKSCDYYYYSLIEQATEKHNFDENGICTVCGDDESLIHEHVFSQYYYNDDATCTENGTEYSYCSICQSEIDERILEDSAHHTWDRGEIVYDANCGYDGEKLFSCLDCDETYTEAIPATGEHTWSSTITQQPTCIATGIRHYTCAVCKMEKDEIAEIDSNNHKYDSGVIIKNPTCSSYGKKLFTCVYCGNSYQSNVSKIEHTYDNGVITKNPTCGSTGTKTFTCQVCGYTKTEGVSKLNHAQLEFVETAPATCSSKGYDLYRCPDCSLEFKTNYADETGAHCFTYGGEATDSNNVSNYFYSECAFCGRQEMVYRNPYNQTIGLDENQRITISKSGEEVYRIFIPDESGTYHFYSDSSYDTYGYLYDCNMNQIASNDDSGNDRNFLMSVNLEAGKCYIFVTRFYNSSTTGSFVINVTRGTTYHSFDVNDSANNGSCTSSTSHNCVNCGASFSAIGHKYVFSKTVEPICTQMGYDVYVCEECEAEIRTNYTSAGANHNFEIVENFEIYHSTADVYYCTICESIYLENVVKETQHNFDVIETVEPTCTTLGYDVVYCADCDLTCYDNYIAGLSHQYLLEQSVEPTCTEFGYDIFKCANCDSTYYDNYVEPIGHCYQVNENINATCTSQGYTVMKCESCGTTYNTNYTAMVDHSFVEDSKVEHSVNQSGYTVYKCEYCGIKYNAEYVSHIYELVETVESTCTEKGFDRSVCTVCDYNYVTEKPLIAHDFDVEVVVESTCITRGIATNICKVCGYKENVSLPFAEHSYELQSTSTPATCFATGRGVYSCTVCGNSYSDSIPRLEHSIVDEYCENCGNHIQDLKINEFASAEYTAGQYCYYRFIPNEDGNYYFFSDIEMDTYGYLYDSTMNQITSSDDDGRDNNFRISYNLEAGKTYYLGVRFYSDSIEGNISVCITNENVEHIYELLNTVEATHFSEGYDEYICAGCGKVYKENIVNPVESISYSPIKPKYVYENTNGYWNTDHSENLYFNYNYNGFAFGDVLTVSYKDGNVIEYTYKNVAIYDEENDEEYFCNRFVSDDGEILNNTSYGDSQYITHWSIDSENVYYVSYLNVSTEVPIEVKHFERAVINLNETTSAIFDGNQYVEFEFTPEVDGYYGFISLSSEDTYGYICDEYGNTLDSDDDSGNGNNFRVCYEMAAGQKYVLKCRFYNNRENGEFDVLIKNINYNLGALEEDVTAVTPKEMEYGSYFTFTPNEYGYYHFDFNINDGYLQIKNSNDEYIASSNSNVDVCLFAGETYRIYVTNYENDEAYLTVSKIDTSNIEGISVSCSNATLYEYISGTWSSFSDNFWYDTNKIIYRTTVTVHYKDGSSEDFCLNEGNLINGYRVNYSDNQTDDNAWSVGGNNIITFDYLGFTAQLSVKVIENPVESIELIPAKPKYVYENKRGYWTSAWNDETDEDERYYYYYFTGLSQGDVLVVHKTDGSTVNYIYHPYEEDEGGYFYNENDEDDIIRYDWDGEGRNPNYVWISDSQYYHHWYLGRDNYFQVSYMNQSCDVQIEVKSMFVGNLALNEETTLEFDDKGQTAYYFAPEEDGYYNFDLNINYGYLQINDSDDNNVYSSGSDISVYLSAGETYRIYVTNYENDEAYLTVSKIDTSNIESISVSCSNATLYEYISGTWGSFSDRFWYDADKVVNKTTVTVHYKDGSSKDFYLGDGNLINGYRIDCLDNQTDDNEWTVGGNNIITFNYLGFTAELNVEIVENPVESIEFIPLKPYSYVENTNGYLTDAWNDETEEDEDYFQYYSPRLSRGDVLVVHKTDGSTVNYIYHPYEEDEGGYFYNENDEDDIIRYDWEGEGSNPNYVSTSNNQYDFHWTLGSNNYFQVSYMNRVCDVPVEIVENPVESISYTSINSKFIENVDGYFSEYEKEYYDEELDEWFYEYGEYFYYDSYRYNAGDVLTVNYKDGRIVKYTYSHEHDEDDNCIEGFTSENGEFISREDVDVYDRQMLNPWELNGEHNYFYVEYCGIQAQVPIEIVENPVESIEFIPLNSYSLIENARGWYDTDDNGEEYFQYRVPNLQVGDVLVVNYKDGSSSSYSYKNGIYEGGSFHNINDEDDVIRFDWEGEGSNPNYVRISDNQYASHWMLGTDNRFCITYMNQSFDVPVEIIESPVESIEYKPENPITLIENTHGYWEETEHECYDEENDEWYTEYYEYYYYSVDYNDESSVLTINYKDGRSVDYKYFHNHDEYGNCNEGYLSVDGDFIDSSYVEFDSNQNSKKFWTIDGENNYFVVRCMGTATEVPVKIIENPIDYIEARPLAKLVQNDGCYSQECCDGEDEFLYYDINKMEYELTIHNNDGTVETKKVHVFDSRDFYIESNQSCDNQWSIDNNDMIAEITYMNKTASVHYEMVEENPVESFEIVQTNKNVNELSVWNLVDILQVNVNYKDGSSSTYCLNDLYQNEYDMSYKDNIYSERRVIKENYLLNVCLSVPVDNDDMIVEDGCTVNIAIGEIEQSIELQFNSSDEETDDSVLNAIYNQILALDADDYSQESIEELMNVVAEFEEMLDGGSYSQSDIDYATTSLISAYTSLVPYLIFNVSADNGIVECSETTSSVLYGTDVTLTATPNTGYEFAGWYEVDTNRYFSTDLTYTFTITSNTNLKAVFVKKNATTLTFINISGQVVKIIENTPDEWNEIASINRLLPKVPYKLGYTNGRWVYDEVDVLSRLVAGENVTIAPEYDATDYETPEIPTPVDDEPALSMHYLYDVDNNVGSFEMAVGVPESCTVESVGIAFYYKNANEFDPCDFVVTLNNKMLTSKYTSLDEDVYITNLNNLSGKYNYAVRGYMTYRDKDGNLKTAYSNQINVVDKQQV